MDFIALGMLLGFISVATICERIATARSKSRKLRRNVRYYTD